MPESTSEESKTIEDKPAEQVDLITDGDSKAEDDKAEDDKADEAKVDEAKVDEAKPEESDTTANRKRLR